MSAIRWWPQRMEWDFPPLNNYRIADIHPPGGYMWNMDIPAIWDVIWGQTNPFPTLDRPPNILSAKDRLSKKIILTNFEPLTEAAVIAYKVLSKEVCPQVKKWQFFFSQTRSQRVLIGFQWLLYEKASILVYLKGCKIGFLLWLDLTPLWYPECSKCISLQNP